MQRANADSTRSTQEHIDSQYLCASSTTVLQRIEDSIGHGYELGRSPSVEVVGLSMSREIAKHVQAFNAGRRLRRDQTSQITLFGCWVEEYLDIADLDRPIPHPTFNSEQCGS